MGVGMTVRTGPTHTCRVPVAGQVFGCVSAGFDRDDVGADRTHSKCRGLGSSGVWGQERWSCAVAGAELSPPG